MGTRSAIFKEQLDGTFLGIYCHWDGYIDGVGAILYKHYQNPEKIQQVIDQGKGLSCLGVKPEVLYEYENIEYRQLTYCGWHEFCLYARKETEVYCAQSLEEIRNFDYLTLTDEGRIDGWEEVVNGYKVFTPYRGSDNNGYLYVQRQTGEWLVSSIDSFGKMKPFEQLEQRF
ncbi:hypothetical protein [Candidatus Enterococcus leclercqii]|uniref:hypothetical protein n=1 Tax=Candidatus Enterococcus leclercqii TaxID=1857218 RepID=UPI00137A4642|nr:hypothetical protein [Enterococcus sp. CU9D]KAF1294216.1 hypothetical protein BAU14_07455 [Enterococcus sp. CU9D]